MLLLTVVVLSDLSLIESSYELNDVNDLPTPELVGVTAFELFALDGSLGGATGTGVIRRDFLFCVFLLLFELFCLNWPIVLGCFKLLNLIRSFRIEISDVC